MPETDPAAEPPDGPSPVPPPVLTGGVWTPGRRLLTVGLILLVTLVASEALAVATVMPQVERDLGNLGLYGWVFSAFFLGSLVGIVVSGRACDRMRPVIPFGIGLRALRRRAPAGRVGHLDADARRRRGLLQGLGAGALPAVAYVCIGRQYPPESRPRMFALLSTAWVVPSLIGPSAAAVVGSHFGWKWVFLGLVPVVVACGAVVIGSVARVAAPAEPESSGSDLPRRAARRRGRRAPPRRPRPGDPVAGSCRSPRWASRSACPPSGG